MYTHIWSERYIFVKVKILASCWNFHCIFASARIFVMDVASECASQKKQSLSSALSQNLKCILTVFNRPQLFAPQFSFHLTSLLFLNLILSSCLDDFFWHIPWVSKSVAVSTFSVKILEHVAFLVAKFGTYVRGAPWWPNLELKTWDQFRTWDQSEKMRSIAFDKLANPTAFDFVFGCDHISPPFILTMEKKKKLCKS